jgi:hypothetical protein
MNQEQYEEYSHLIFYIFEAMDATFLYSSFSGNQMQIGMTKAL